MEQPISNPSVRITETEYLRLEEAASTKHEYRHGRMIEMAGGTFEHAAIAANLVSQLTIKLAGKPCRALGSDLRVRVSDFGHYCYPDVTVVCGPPIFDPPDKRTTITNPQVVIEVSSASTAAEDRGDKFYDYMSIESLQQYLIVSQDRARVDTFFRQSDGIWAIGPSFEGLAAAATFRTLDISIALADIYTGIDLAALGDGAAGEPT